jgi:hypothetical protein
MSEVPSLRRKNLEADEDEYQRIKRFIIGKARRYKLDPVPISDRLTVSLSVKQLDRLRTEVVQAGFAIEFKEHARYGDGIAKARSEGPTHFGSSPRNGGGARHPKAPDWASG